MLMSDKVAICCQNLLGIELMFCLFRFPLPENRLVQAALSSALETQSGGQQLGAG